MKKILISINNKTIYFSYKTSNSNINNDLINTNIISNNELIFSDKYIMENTKILSSFVKELSLQYNVDNVVISKVEIADIVLNILSKASFSKLTIKEDEPLTYSIVEKIANNKNIKLINCYSLQPFMIEILDKNNITCESRSEILYVSNFMQHNNLLCYSNIYYKTNVRIDIPLSLEDKEDFANFCKVNKYLKSIHISKLINKELEEIIKILASSGKRNVSVVIHENITDEKTASYLRELNKKYKKDYKISLTLQYSKDYIDNNLFKQTMINLLRVCGLIISSLVILVITYIGVENYVNLKDVNKVQNDLKNKIKDFNPIGIIEDKNEKNLDDAKDNDIPVDEVKFITNAKLARLLSINEDVVAELKVNNTEIDYSVVQGEDNTHYLRHNINNEWKRTGWIFLDYRNNPMNLDKNNIIYGHTFYYSTVMFGTLNKVANRSWYTDPENQIITYNTLYENMSFKIFSIYRVPKTSDYLQVHFKDDEEFMNFANMITERSIYNFNVPINKDDIILTLSTCADNGNKRLVVHAVLQKELNSN